MSRVDYAGVETVLKDEFLGNLLKMPQQTSTRLFGGFSNVTVSGKDLFIDGVAPLSYRIDNSENADSIGSSAEFFRRKLNVDRMIIEVDYDRFWFEKTAVNNPAGLLHQEMVKAASRFLDKIGIEASFASVYYGRRGESTMTFAQDGGITIDATSGLTETVIRKIIHRLTGVEAIEPDGQSGVKWIISEDEQYDLKGLTTLISGDYQRLFPSLAAGNRNGTGFEMVNGMRIVTFGSQAITGKMLEENAGVRDCIAMTGEALIYGLAPGGINFDIIEMKETKVDTIRLRMTLTAGVVRKSGYDVIKFQTTVKDTSTFYA